MTLHLQPPEPLAASHVLASFACGEVVLDDWLKRRALTNQQNGASRTFVVADNARCVYGYYALAAGAVTHQLATANVRRNMPDPVPVLVLGRLAVYQRARGIQLGGALLQDAVKRAQLFSQSTGVRAILVHALNTRASQFYQHYGFVQSPIDSLTLMLRLNAIPV